MDGDENLTSNDLEFARAKGDSRPIHSRRLPVWHDFVVEYKIKVNVIL